MSILTPLGHAVVANISFGRAFAGHKTVISGYATDIGFIAGDASGQQMNLDGNGITRVVSALIHRAKLALGSPDTRFVSQIPR